MKCGKSILALMLLLGSIANVVAGSVPVWHLGTGSQSSASGVPVWHLGTGSQPSPSSQMLGSAPINSGNHFHGSRHFRGSHRIDGIHQFSGIQHFDGAHHHRHAPIVVFIRAPIFWTWDDPVAPNNAPPISYGVQNGGTIVLYYCGDSRSYYPAVMECSGGWQTITVSTAPRN